LTCSIGIAANKLIANIASKIKKPDGLTIVNPGSEKDFLKDLKPSAMPGIGKKTEEFLKKKGIKKIHDLQKKSAFWFIKNFGKIGVYYYHAVNGIDKEKVGDVTEIKSIGKEKTFANDVSDTNMVAAALDKLCEDVWNEVRKEGFYFKCIELKIRYGDFETHTYTRTFLIPIDEKEFFKEIVKEMVLPYLFKPVRLVGVRVKKLLKER